MTTLTIAADLSKKKMKFAGTIAAGEQVAVTVVGAGSDFSNVRLRVATIAHNKTLAVFPAEDGDAWGAGGTCTLNLNTAEMAEAVKTPRELGFILDDMEDGVLLAVGIKEVLPWPKEAGRDVPYDLREYPDRVAALEAALANEIADRASEDDAESVLRAEADSELATRIIALERRGRVQPDWNETNDESDEFIKNKPELVAVATSGEYDDLNGKPKLAEVATSGSYKDLEDKPEIPGPPDLSGYVAKASSAVNLANEDDVYALLKAAAEHLGYTVAE